MKPVRNAISFVLFERTGARTEEEAASGPPPGSGRRRVLTVRRPEDDEDLPGAWGLPAGSLREEETFADAVLTAGREKLGVELEVEEMLEDGQIEREEYVVYMKLFRVRLVEGDPGVPQPVEGITQYVRCEWADPERLRPAARRGSLCSQIFLDYLDVQASDGEAG